MKKFLSVLAPSMFLILVFSALFFQTGCEENNPEPCDPPTNLQVIGISPTTATIGWSAPPNTTVSISVSPDPTPSGPFITSDTVFTITGLNPDTDYKVTVQTVCADGSLSAPVQIALRTSIIIIVDVIIQYEAILADATSICSSMLTDDTDRNAPINWNPGIDEELLVITEGVQASKVLIYKRKNSSGVFEYISIANNRAICAHTAQNVPFAVQTTVNGARLLGSNYVIDLNSTSAVMSNSTGIVYSMYR
jgi:hypothetical protein